jgi:hypothetical protein
MLALIKLQNGTEVIGNVIENMEQYLAIEDPMQINYRLVPSSPMPTVSVSRYMPFSGEQIITFAKKDMLHMVEPRKTMADYYKHALTNYRMSIDKNVDEELKEATREPIDLEDASEEDVNDAYKALLERINLKGPLN